MENCKYQKTSIREALREIQRRNYLLPGIQRKFEWKAQQITMLFDSIIQGYPINSFMFWRVTDASVKKNYTFYEFLDKYAEKFKDENPKVATELKGEEDFYAVVDGQQRLTSLYLGMTGTYLYKLPNKQYHEKNLIPQVLFLNLTSELQDTNNTERKYEFKFLDPKKIDQMDDGKFWFRVGEVLKFEDRKDVRRYLKAHKLDDNEFADETLMTLYERVSIDELINYCVISGQNQDKILNIFIRTNSGGTKLSPSNLMMSMIADSWDHEVRKEMEEIRDRVSKYGREVPFRISPDFILKTMLVLSDGDVRFKIRNFNTMHENGFEENWESMRDSIIVTYEMLGRMGFNNDLLKAKNAVIPIVYYVYKSGISDKFGKPNYDPEDCQEVVSWLTKSLLKGIFSGHPDSTLTTMRGAIKDELAKGAKRFPAAAIIEKFRGNLEKNYSFDDDALKKMLKEKYQSPRAGLVLMLLYPQVVSEHGAAVAQDHMHPKVMFRNWKKLKEIGFSEEDEKFALENYNTVLNLQLLEEYANKEKKEASLVDWVRKVGVSREDLMVKGDTSLEIADFREFIDTRREKLLDKLREISC